MRNVNVIDLDNTLIPFDSFRSYIFIFIKYKEFTLKIVLLIFLRFFRVLNKTSFKKEIFKITSEHKNYDIIMEKFSKKLIDDYKSVYILYFFFSFRLFDLYIRIYALIVSFMATI